MRLIPVTAPAALPVSLAEVKAQLRSTPQQTADDEALSAMLKSVVSMLDGYDGRLGRALITQVWRAELSHFPWRGYIRLPLPPLQAVTEFRYLDTDGELQTVDPAIYDVVGAGGSERGEVRCVSGAVWPATYAHPSAVSITFRCGYGDAAAAVPAPLRSAILDIVVSRALFRTSVSPTQSFRVPGSAAEVINDYRIRSFG